MDRPDATGLRGDYSRIDARYVVPQAWDRYTEDQHALWRRLYERQIRLLPGRACDEFIRSLASLDVGAGVPNFERTSDLLDRATGWRLVAVPGLVPDRVFFDHLGERRFPVTVWLRKPEEIDYIVEPDVFHDFFGHVPLLFDRVYADHLEAYGKGGLKALRLGALAELARLYWYTIEFGLIRSPHGLRVYGAGILSSPGEIEYALTSRTPHRIAFDVERTLRTLFRIDAYQETYFVIRDFRQLFEDTAPDFTPIYPKVRALPPIAADALLPGEVELPIES